MAEIAFTSGIPIIAILNGEGVNVVEDAGAGISCPAGDQVALVAAIRRLVSMSKAELATMGSKGRSVSKRNFDRDTLITQLEIWLQEKVAESRRTGLFNVRP